MVGEVTLFAGMSGWAYPDWQGSFYPAKLATAKMLPFYAGVFNTVEVNNTFYRMPPPEAVASWRDQAPPDFRFSFKAHRAITHRKRFADDTEVLDRFAELMQVVGDRLGPVLFQFDTIADVPQLEDFLAVATTRFARVVVEFRHKSWFTDACFDLLRRTGVALCQTETDDGADPVLDSPTFAYRRLRRSAYTLQDVEQHLAALRRLAPDRDVFAYFKHDAANAVLLRSEAMGG